MSTHPVNIVNQIAHQLQNGLPSISNQNICSVMLLKGNVTTKLNHFFKVRLNMLYTFQFIESSFVIFCESVFFNSFLCEYKLVQLYIELENTFNHTNIIDMPCDTQKNVY